MARRVAVARQSGVALVAALWLIVLLTVVASGFAYSMRGEALAARNALSLAQARLAADGAVERAAFELGRPHNVADAEVWQADGAPHAWQEGDVRLAVTAVDEAARIDLNAAPEPLLKSLFVNVGGVDADTAQHLAEAVEDWRDPDDLRRPNGAEADDYKAAGRKYGPANAPFTAVGELLRVLGMTPGVMAKVADTLTVYSWQAAINPATASRDVLLALPNMTPEIVDAYLAARADALANKLPPPPLPQATGFAVGAAPVWRIHAEATAPDGVTFVREAVVRPSGDARRPIVALLWQEGEPAPQPQPNAAGSDAGAKS